MSGQRAKHIFFSIDYWRDLEKEFADSAAKYAPDDTTRNAIIARCRIGLMRFLEHDAEFGTAKEVKVARKGGRPRANQGNRLHVWLAVEVQKAMSKKNTMNGALAPIFRRGRPWRVVTNLVDGNHLDVETFDKAERLHREGQQMLDANPTLARVWAGHLALLVASRKKAQKTPR